MSVPKQILEQAELAEKFMSDLNEESDSEETAEEEEKDEEESDEEADEEEVDTDETDEDETSDEEEADTSEEEDYKARYMTLKGKYDAEVPRLSNDLKEFKEKVFSQLGDPNRKEEPADKDDTPITDEQLARYQEEYGDDFLEAVRYVAKQEVSQGVKDGLQPVTEKVDQVEGSQVAAATAEFTSHLDDNVNGEWSKLWAGEDPKFLEFLDQPDPSGLYTYGELAAMYNDTWQAEKLTKLFNLYLGEKPEVKDEEPAPKKKGKEDLVAPSRKPAASKPVTDGDQIIWTEASMEEFKLKDRQGKYSDEESQKLWDDLLLAPSQGRIQ